jgi:hypothetical protein
MNPPAAHVPLCELAARWSVASAGERANAQFYLTELAEALGVERPRRRGTGWARSTPRASSRSAWSGTWKRSP